MKWFNNLPKSTKLNILSILCLAILVSASVFVVQALTPISQVTGANWAVLNGSGTLQSYDGSINIGLGNLGNVQFIGLQNTQVLGWNATLGMWQNVNASAGGVGPQGPAGPTGATGPQGPQGVAGTNGTNGVNYHYSMENLTDANYVGLTNGDIAMWNSTTSQWYNAHPFTTGWNTTVNQLINNAAIAWSQIASANSTVNALISAYIASNPPAFSTLTGVPAIGAYTYLIQANDPIAGNYSARYPNGTIAWTSTNQTAVLANITAIGSVGQVIYVQKGASFGSDCTLTIRNATQTMNAGQVAIYNGTSQASLASATSNQTVGYGYVYLNVINCTANNLCLLTNNCVFTNSAYSFTSGAPEYIALTAGAFTETYPASTGNQDVECGTAWNSTTISFMVVAPNDISHS